MAGSEELKIKWLLCNSQIQSSILGDPQPSPICTGFSLSQSELIGTNWLQIRLIEPHFQIKTNSSCFYRTRDDHWRTSDLSSFVIIAAASIERREIHTVKPSDCLLS